MGVEANREEKFSPGKMAMCLSTQKLTFLAKFSSEDPQIIMKELKKKNCINIYRNFSFYKWKKQKWRTKKNNFPNIYVGICVN